MRDITDIYSEYKIMPMLAIHQIRVAAVANIVCDSLSVPVDKDNIIKACLLHDMGNIIKFNLNHFPIQKNEPRGVDYWEQVKEEYIIKYGNNEHVASVKIAKELDMPNYVIDLVASVESALILDKSIKNDNDFGKKICNYADGRVTPHNVTSIKERSDEAKKRYENHPHYFSEKDRFLFVSEMEEIEKEIFVHSKIKPEDINDDSVQNYIDKLKTFELN